MCVIVKSNEYSSMNGVWLFMQLNYYYFMNEDYICVLIRTNYNDEKPMILLGGNNFAHQVKLMNEIWQI